MGHLEAAREIRGLHGRYAVVSRLSRGDRRAVHLGRDERGRSVVLTELHASDIADWGDVERTVAEGKLLGDLAHERIPRLVECFATDGERAMPASRFTETFVDLEGPPEEGARLPSLVLVRAFVEGESVEEAIARRRRFASADLVRFARSLFEIVAFLHELHPPIALGELARSSVVIDPAGEAHLVDVGVAVRNGATAAGPSEGDVRPGGALSIGLYLDRAPPVRDAE